MHRVGDKVKILNESAEGTIKKILGAKLALVQIGEFDYEISTDQLLHADGAFSPVVPSLRTLHTRFPEIFSPADQELQQPHKQKKVQLKKGKKSFAVREVDLHCHEIIEDYSGINPSGILDYQIRYFIRELQCAIRQKEKSIIFIHGKGEGILKSEIHKILSTYQNVIFFEAPLRRYGGGATMVEIGKG